MPSTTPIHRLIGRLATLNTDRTDLSLVTSLRCDYLLEIPRTRLTFYHSIDHSLVSAGRPVKLLSPPPLQSQEWNKAYHTRPPGRRLAAMVYDSLLGAALMFTFTFILIVLRGGTAISPASWGFSISLLALNILFFGWSWTHGGQTLGMRVWKIRVERLVQFGSPNDLPSVFGEARRS